MSNRRGFLAALLGASTMPTIYRWLNPVTVDQARYNSLITREGYFATPTAQPNLDTPINVSTPILNAADYKDLDNSGVRDVTATIQAAMNKAVATGTELYIGPGEYLVRQLNVPKGLMMRGYSAGGTGIDVGKHTRFNLKSGTNAHMLKGAVGAAHVRISNIHFDGNKNNNTSGDIIHLDDAGTAEEGQWHIRDCFLDAAAGYGIYVGAGRRAVQISDSSICYSRLSGIRMNGSDGHIDRCILGTNLEHGIGIGGTVCNVNDCDIYGNGTTADTNTGDGITIFSTITLASIRGNRIDQNKRHGVLISGSCEAITVSGNMFHGNSQHGNGNHNGVHVVSTTGSITVANNVFGVDGNVSNKSGYAVGLAAGATAVGSGNTIQALATVNGMTNTIPGFEQGRQAAKLGLWAPASAVAQTFDRADAVVGNVTSNITSGRLHVMGGFVVPAGQKVTSFSWCSGNASPSGVTNQWAVLFRPDGTIITKTADFTNTTISTNAFRTWNFAATFLPWVDTPVYVGLVVVASTMPDFRGINGSSQPFGLTPLLAATGNTGLTDPASLTSIGALTATTGLPYAYLS